MIRWVELQDFKCFESLRLPLGSLTLLSGANASGKSTVIQSFVLMHQTIREHEWSTRLMLNGGTIQLGTVTDVVDELHGRDAYQIALCDDGETVYRWRFEGERGEMSMAVNSVSVDGTETKQPQVLHYLLPPEEQSTLAARLRDLTYLTAERLGPREAYPLQDPEFTPVVGPRGEHAASVLHFEGDKPVSSPELVIEDTAPTLLHQAEAHMDVFFPGCRINVQKIPNVNAVTLGLRTSNAEEFHSPVHTGFGLTQLLPVVVAALSVRSPALLLIENPEVHLHPAGQAAIGELLAKVALGGVQVILETHSDHVLNGVRRAVKEGVLAPGDIALHFFRPRREDGRDDLPQVESPALDTNGNIDTWPEGFFDQFDRDMNYFAGWDAHETPGQ